MFIFAQNLKRMKRLLLFFSLLCLLTVVPAQAQQVHPKDTTTAQTVVDTLAADSLMSLADADLEEADADMAGEGGSLHKQLKRKFIEGSAGFMSLVALALVLGLAFCIERIVFLTLSEVNTRKLMKDVDERLAHDDVEGAKTLCRNTRGPVASICYQALMHIKEPLEQIDRQLTNYGEVQLTQMEKGCSWIRLDTDGGRHLAGHRGTRHEGGTDHHHLRYHRSHRPAILLQLYPVEDTTPDGTDGKQRHRADGCRR